MYTALKPCKLCGNKYFIGDIVNVDLLTKQEIESLIKKKYLAYGCDENTNDNTDDKRTQEQGITAVPVINKDGSSTVELSNEEIAEVFTVLQLSDSKKAMQIVSEITNINELLLLKETVCKKDVKTFVINHYNEIAKTQGFGESR